MKNIKVILMFCLMFTGFFTFASDVYIETHNEEGQGILRSIGRECLVYTPAHVVARASDFLVSTRLEKRIKSQLITTYPQDLALLKLPSAAVSACHESSWKDEGDRVNTILEVVDKGELQVRLNNGRLVTYNIDIIDKELHSFFTVRLNHPTKKISKGMSGGIVTVGNYPIGMLLSVEDELGKVLRMDTIADASRSVVKSYATEKELIALNIDSAESESQKPSHTRGIPSKNMATVTSSGNSGKMIFKGRIAQGATETYSILSRGNTAYRLHSKKQSDPTRINIEYQNPAKKRLASSGDIVTGKDKTWGFGTTERGEHFLVVEGDSGSGSYELELEVISTPEQLLSDSNVLGHGDTAKGMVAHGTYAIYKIMSRGNTAYRLHSKKQSDPTRIEIQYQNPAKKRLASSGDIVTGKDKTWGFGTAERGEHFLVIEGDGGSGSYGLELEIIATPEQQLSDSNVLGHGDTAKGMTALGTYAIYKIMSRGNTAYRLHSKKQSDPTKIEIEYQNPAKKRLASSGDIATGKDKTWSFGTTERGEHFLVIEGDGAPGSYELELEVIKE